MSQFCMRCRLSQIYKVADTQLREASSRKRKKKEHYNFEQVFSYFHFLYSYIIFLQLPLVPAPSFTLNARITLMTGLMEEKAKTETVSSKLGLRNQQKSRIKCAM